MKKLIFYIIVLLFASCNNKELELKGDFVKVLKKDIEFNLYTFDFNNTLIISNNGDNYIITNKEGNKSIATIDKGVISYNNCKIIIDRNENVLTNTCLKNNKSYSDDYWPKDKVDNYLKNIKNVKYNDYINKYINSESDGYNSVATISDLNDDDKKHMDKTISENNPYYPFICIGDFNNDNKYPDIAAISTNEEGGDIYEKDWTSLSFLHAGSEKLQHFEFKEFYPFMETSLGDKIGNDDKFQDRIRIYNLKEWSGWDIIWSGRNYKVEYVNLH